MASVSLFAKSNFHLQQILIADELQLTRHYSQLICGRDDTLLSCDDICYRSAMIAMDECDAELVEISEQVWPSRPLDTVKYVSCFG